MSMNGNYLLTIVREKVINALYPKTNALQIKIREYLVEKNKDKIETITVYIASRYWPIYKGNSSVNFSELLDNAFLELGIDKESLKDGLQIGLLKNQEKVKDNCIYG